MDSPKTRFLKSTHSKTFADMIATPAFIAAVDAALLQMTHDMGTAPEMGIAAANQFRMEGARRFLATLLDLPNITVKNPVNYRENLEQ